MAAENKQEAILSERLSLEGRRVLKATGVREVLRFDDSAVVLQTADRLLIVRGEGLSLRQLAPEEGRVEVRGQIEALGYQQGGENRSLLKRLLG